MTDSLVYRMPSDRVKVAGVVKAVPLHWSGMTGHFYAPRELYIDRRIAAATMLKIGYKTELLELEPGTSDAHLAKGASGARVNDVLLKGKFPSQVSFDVRGDMLEHCNIGSLRDLASGFIDLGYSTELKAFNRWERYDSLSAVSGPAAILEISDREKKVTLQNSDGGIRAEDLESIKAALEAMTS